MSIPPADSSTRNRFPPVAGAALLAALVALVGLLASLRGRPAVAPAGSEVVPFRLATLDGRQLGPADFGGQVVLIDFWATWCSPCHVQAEILAELYPRLRAKGIEFLAVSVGEPEGTVREHAARRPYLWPVLLDPEQSAADAMSVVSLPTLVVVGRDGRVVFRESGVVDASTLERILSEAARG